MTDSEVRIVAAAKEWLEDYFDILRDKGVSLITDLDAGEMASGIVEHVMERFQIETSLAEAEAVAAPLTWRQRMGLE